MEKELRILMIEDVPHDAELEVRELKRAGMRVLHRVVETEQAFRESLSGFRPDLIISDFSMPHFDGMWALSLAHELVPDVPFIFVSGTIGEEYAIRALKNGATDYVLKNNLVRLPAAVERALQDREVQAARRRAEVEVARQRAFLRQVIDLDRSHIFAKDREGRFMLANQAVADAYGCTVEDLLGKPTGELISDPEQSGRFRKSDLEVIDGMREVFIPEQQVTDAAGKVRWFQVVKRPLTSADGKQTMVLAVGTDITDRKLQELKIARLNRIHEVLSGINSAIVRVRDRGSLFKEACRIAVEHGKFGLAWIGLFDPVSLDVTPVAWDGIGSDELKSSKSTAREDVSQGQGLVGQAIRGRKLALSNDISIDTGVGGKRRQEALRLGYRSLIALPLFTGEAVVGIFAIFAKEPNFFDGEEIKLLTELANDVSFALEHLAGQKRIEKLSRVRTVSGEINAAIVRIRNREELFAEVCRIAVEHGKFVMAWIGTLDETAQEIKPVAKAGREDGYLERIKLTIDPDTTRNLGMAVEAIARRAPVLCNDIANDGRMRPWRAAALERGYRSSALLPLVLDQQSVGIFALYAGETGLFDEEEMKLLSEIAGDISFALDNIKKGEKLDYLAYYDAVTGLPNRALFNDRLDQQVAAAHSEHKGCSVMMLDVERFRQINETLGRQAGDLLLRQIAARLKEALGETDILAHIGGDYFTIATRHAEAGEDVARWLDRILTAISGQAYRPNGDEIRVAARAGIALYPADGVGADALLKNAEAALKSAKTTGQHYQFYAPQMNARVAEQLKLENDLRRAILEDQFILYYQPRVEFAGGRIGGLEALIRWKHPERGMVPPGEFIALLESTGLILDVGRWALRRAAQDHAAWRAKGVKPPRVAVNVSAVQLQRKDFVEDFKVVMAEAGDSRQYMDIEITESMLMADLDGNIEKLRAVREMGVEVALDDFGTGYSSLSYLARLPISSLKIDRSFVTQMVNSPEQMAIVSTVISLARALNLKVVAEGVETEEQANLLRLLRCDEAQGYLYAKPMSPKEVEEMLPKA